MFDVREKPRKVERALLVGVYQQRGAEAEADSLLRELEDLVAAIDIPVLDRLLLRCPSLHAGLLMGTGKADEVAEHAKALDIDCIVFDNELSPAQQRNWEALTDITTIDRQEIILDIFAARAATREAKLQVELARLEYTFPRLKRHWSHLSRQGGAGPAAKGEGEKQIEIDRRLIRQRIDRLKKDLVVVRGNRDTQRKTRSRVPLPQAAIVGYTNAGKSSLLRRLTGAEVFVADQLFATLDPTTRRLELPNGAILLLTDTVGFVRNLPHRLVEAFKATLEEAVRSDLLIHVLDASHPEVESFHRTTMAVLRELGAEEKRTLTVFNKIDLIADRGGLADLRRRHPDALFVSVHSQEGLDALVDRLADALSDRMLHVDLAIPQADAGVMSALHRNGRVLHARYEHDLIHVQALVPLRLQGRVLPYVNGAT